MGFIYNKGETFVRQLNKNQTLEPTHLPIVFTHLLSGIAITGACFLIMKKPRSLPLLAVGLASFVLPDIDHLLYWEPYMANLLLPMSFSDLFKGLFGP